MTYPKPDPRGPPTLTAGENAWLRQLGDLVPSAPTRSRDIAISVVIHAARSYRRTGVTWAQIAIAIGVDLGTLLDWRDCHPPEVKAHGFTRQPQRGRRTALGRRHPSVLSTSTVLACSGHPKPNNNDFSSEIALIRQHMEPRLPTKEVVCVQPDEIANLLSDHCPQIFHLAAHSNGGSVFLSLGAEPIPVQHSHLVQAIMRSSHRTPIIVLNFCDSIVAGRTLAGHGSSVICWPGMVHDGQSRELAGLLYRNIAGGRTLGDSVDNATITLTRWTGLLLPQLFGEGNLRVLQGESRETDHPQQP
jgi:hypothetical protein